MWKSEGRNDLALIPALSTGRAIIDLPGWKSDQPSRYFLLYFQAGMTIFIFIVPVWSIALCAFFLIKGLIDSYLDLGCTWESDCLLNQSRGFLMAF